MRVQYTLYQPAKKPPPAMGGGLSMPPVFNRVGRYTYGGCPEHRVPGGYTSGPQLICTTVCGIAATRKGGDLCHIPLDGWGGDVQGEPRAACHERHAPGRAPYRVGVRCAKRSARVGAQWRLGVA